MIDLRYKAGPFGDCTSNYDVRADAKTVGEFIDKILAGEMPDNYITICIRADRKKDVAVVEIYREMGSGRYYIKRKAESYEVYRAVTISSIFANGGWGRMNYDIKSDADFPEQDRSDFKRVYFGL